MLTGCKKKLKFAIPALIVVWLLTGPLPISEVWRTADAVPEYRRATEARLAKLSPVGGQGELQIGTARREISSALGQPLMGFTNRKPLASTGVHSPCYASALTLRCGGVAVTVVTMDIFLLLPELTEEIVRLSGLPAEELYFTATHTHSGPGGWAEGGIMQLIYGRADGRNRRHIAAAAAAAIRESRDGLRLAKVFSRRAETPGMLENRIYKGERPAREIIEALVFRDAARREKILATLITYAAHATLVRPAEHRCSADYPGFLRDAWEKSQGGLAMFAAGYIGDARAAGGVSAENFGRQLAEILAKAPEEPLAVNSLRRALLPVDAPRTRIPCGKKWCWAPLFAPYLLSEQTRICGLRLGDIVLLGLPGDVAGEMAPELEKAAAGRGLRLLLTSFNGDWRCYFTTDQTARERNAYETRMGFLGPRAGGYFTDLCQMVVGKLAE